VRIEFDLSRYQDFQLNFTNSQTTGMHYTYSTVISLLVITVSGVAQWQNVCLWPANFPWPAPDLQAAADG